MPKNHHLRVVAKDAPARPEVEVRSDEELVTALMSGERRLGSEICERLLHSVDAALYRIMGRRESDHDDLVQAALEQIVMTLYSGKFDGRCNLNTWASAIACNVGLHAIRRRKLERRLFVDTEGDDVEQVSRPLQAGDLERQALARQELERVRYHLAQLSPKLSHALVVHDVLGCNLVETASIVKASLSATQSRVARGRRELSERLQRDAELDRRRTR